jgi:hypothetical protein
MTRPALPAPALTPGRPRAPSCRGGASTLLRVVRSPGASQRPRTGLWAAWCAAQAASALAEPQPGFITLLQPSVGVPPPRGV